MMMIGIGLVGFEESRPLKAAIGKLALCKDDGFAVTLARRRDIDRQRNAASLNILQACVGLERRPFV